MLALYGIQDYIFGVVEAVKQISGIDMEVIDDRHYRVAGTGWFRTKINEYNSDNCHGYRYCLEQGKTFTISNPGRHFLCRDCEKKESCGHYYVIAVPVIMDEKVIGGVAFVCTNPDKKAFIETNTQSFRFFLQQMAKLFVTKVENYIENQKHIFERDFLNILTEHTNQGILVLDRDNKLVLASRKSLGDLRVNSYQDSNMFVNIIKQKGRFGAVHEYRVLTRDRNFNVCGEEFFVEEGEEYARILIYEDLKKFMARMDIKRGTVNYGLDSIFSNGKEQGRMEKMLLTAAESKGNTCIISEAGNKVDLLCSMIYEKRCRSREPYVKISCIRESEEQLYRKLFGYRVRDTLTGDIRVVPGAMRDAMHGILVLEDIHQMPVKCQEKLTRVLEQGFPCNDGVCEQETEKLDIQVIAISEKQLKEYVDAGQFSGRLARMLQENELIVQPLRIRKSEIESLFFHYVRFYENYMRFQIQDIDPQVVESLKRYDWPGNVDELERTVRYCMNLSIDDRIISPDKLPRIVRYSQTDKAASESGGKSCIRTLEKVEEAEIRKALNTYGDTRQGKELAAEALGIGIATLYRKLSRMDFEQKTEEYSA